MTPQEVSFTNAFNTNRPTLALFARCATRDELHVVRDAFYLGMASQLCPSEYEALRTSIIIDPSAFNSIASSFNTPNSLESMITAARASEYWQILMDTLHTAANVVDSDLDSIWISLETGRLEWLGAVNSAHPLKVLLKDALKKDCDKAEKDEVDAKMVWMYALSLSIPKLNEASDAWSKAVNMEDKMNPLKGYNVGLWDCRKDEWRPLDLGVQKAAENGGSSVNEAWNA